MSEPPEGKLLVLSVGLGAVATTFFAGVELVRRGRAVPVGSVTQLQSLRGLEGWRARSEPRIRDALGLAPLTDLVFAAWDPYPDNALAAARHAGVLDAPHLEEVRDFLEKIAPLPAAFLPQYVRRIQGPNIKSPTHRYALAEAIREDIRNQMVASDASRAVMIGAASTEGYQALQGCHRTPEAFLAGMEADDPAISPAQLYAWASIMEGVPYANATPNLSGDVPALALLARERGVPVAGKDLKTGQTMLKTVLAPGLEARSLGVAGWFSTNILGNRDGEVLEDEASFRAKEISKAGVLDSILRPDQNPELYGDLTHKVCINYYPPRGDAKEGWDNIDIFGWLGYPMQIKVNFLCRDSILAAPLVLDLVLLLDRAKRAGLSGVQPWLSFFFKSPHTIDEDEAIHDLFLQRTLLCQALRSLEAA